ncbi:hypothetical protein ABXS75_17445 [Roseburia hominis]
MNFNKNESDHEPKFPARTNPGRFSAKCDAVTGEKQSNTTNTKNVKPDDVPRRDGPGGE